MNNWRLLPYLFALLLLQGCSWFDGDDDTVTEDFEPVDLVDIEERFQVETEWTEDIGEGVGEFYNKITPVVNNNRLYIADAEGLITALDAKTGEMIWETEVGSELFGGVAASSGMVAVGSTEAEVIVLDAETGVESWRNLVSSEIVSSPVISDGKVVVRTIDGKVFALNARTGERAWLYDRSVPPLTLRGNASLSAAGGVVVTGFSNGKIVLFLMENGRALWEKRIASASGRSELDRVVDADATPMIVGETIFALTFNGNIGAYNIRNGDALWQRELSSYQNLSVEGQIITVVDARSRVRALDRRTGGTLWTNEELYDRRLTAAVPFGGYLVAGDYEGYIHWFDSGTGRIVARNDIGGDGIVADPVATGTHLYVYTRSGKLVALRAP